MIAKSHNNNFTSNNSKNLLVIKSTSINNNGVKMGLNARNVTTTTSYKKPATKTTKTTYDIRRFYPTGQHLKNVNISCYIDNKIQAKISLDTCEFRHILERYKKTAKMQLVEKS